MEINHRHFESAFSSLYTVGNSKFFIMAKEKNWENNISQLLDDSEDEVGEQLHRLERWWTKLVA